jgi:hypothetical protein
MPTYRNRTTVQSGFIWLRYSPAVINDFVNVVVSWKARNFSATWVTTVLPSEDTFCSTGLVTQSMRTVRKDKCKLKLLTSGRERGVLLHNFCFVMEQASKTMASIVSLCFCGLRIVWGRWQENGGKHHAVVTRSHDPLGSQTKYEFTTQINKDGKHVDSPSTSRFLPVLRSVLHALSSPI